MPSRDYAECLWVALDALDQLQQHYDCVERDSEVARRVPPLVAAIAREIAHIEAVRFAPPAREQPPFSEFADAVVEALRRLARERGQG